MLGDIKTSGDVWEIIVWLTLFFPSFTGIVRVYPSVDMSSTFEFKNSSWYAKVMANEEPTGTTITTPRYSDFSGKLIVSLLGRLLASVQRFHSSFLIPWATWLCYQRVENTNLVVHFKLDTEIFFQAVIQVMTLLKQWVWLV